jgi:hypothetical protein
MWSQVISTVYVDEETPNASPTPDVPGVDRRRTGRSHIRRTARMVRPRRAPAFGTRPSPRRRSIEMSRRTEFSRVERVGLRLADVEVGTSYGAPALKVRGRMFACIPTHRSAEPGSLAVRMSLVERELRLRASPAIYYVKPHYEPYPVVLVRLAKLSDDELAELLETGWAFERGKRRSR